jgi:hypothetical protein
MTPRLSIQTARALRQAGLVWEPKEFDFFAVPDRDLDERVFVISGMPAGVALLHGDPIMTFAGATEWALDYVHAGEVVWLPTEAQLREQVAARLAAQPGSAVALNMTAAGCRCEIVFDGQALSFQAAEASEAYAAALLHLLRTSAVM